MVKQVCLKEFIKAKKMIKQLTNCEILYHRQFQDHTYPDLDLYRRNQ